ncbi:MAG: diguanylate cyclase [Gemmatimonadota bacterium]|nr:diguanylate cyclase [Gemmatimonadota bacterium]
MSIGLAEAPRHGTTQDAILSAADAALYRAKRAGSGRVEIAEP